MAISPIILTQKCLSTENITPDFSLALTAEQRQKVKQRLELDQGLIVHFDLPRGTHIHPQDYFQSTDQEVTIQVTAEAESVLTIRATDSLLLLKAAYHLGNRHVPLEIGADYLRLAPDHVLAEMLQHLGVDIHRDTAPFFPEEGAYGHHAH